MLHIRACCKRTFQVVSGVLKVFHLDVAYVCNGFHVFFMCFCKCFRRMFQVFHLSSFYVATVANGCLKSKLGVAYEMSVESDNTLFYIRTDNLLKTIRTVKRPAQILHIVAYPVILLSFE